MAFVMIDKLKAAYPIIDAGLLKRLFFYHVLLSLTYYVYVLFNPSDSVYYYQKILMNYRGETWMDFYGTSTTFIEFVGYPFVKFLGFSYEAMMALFSFFGFVGFVFFYIFFKESIHFKHRVLGMDFISLVVFLPNLHFWSASFGKGAIIFMAIGAFFFALSKMRDRFILAFIAGVLIYHVRPHIMLMIIVSAAVGLVFSSRGVSVTGRVMLLGAASIAFFFIYKDVLALVGIDETEFLTQGLDLTHRATELSKATSGVDITSYSLPMQIFTFLFRPLFIDAPGALGIVVSFENVFYLYVTFKLIGNMRGLKYLIKGSFLSKTALLSFFTVSIALAQVSGNLGLAIRQKSQVMMLLMFVVLSFLDNEKLKQWHAMNERRKRMSKIPDPAEKV